MIHVSAPSNIAFIKYWGKKKSENDFDRSLALNANISLTLENARSFVSIGESQDYKIFTHGHDASDQDRQKILAHYDRVSTHFGIEKKPFELQSQNNFPTGAGIASSASAFAALTWAFTAHLQGKTLSEGWIAQHQTELSMLSRRGSGSACRSVSGPFMTWEGEFAEDFLSDWKLYDTIVLLSKEEKAVSSSEGHARACSNPKMNSRLKQIPERFEQVKNYIQSKNLESLGRLLEEEALEMHRIAETSSPPIQYLSEDSRNVIHALQNCPGRDFFFTIDAGPNIHVISQRPVKEDLEKLLSPIVPDLQLWEDEGGFGPRFEKGPFNE